MSTFAFRVKTYFSLSLLFIVFYSYSHASQPPKSILTIQTGSFSDIASAQKNFDSIKQSLNGKDMDYLRIEKIGKFYAVRLGKFEDSASAENVLKTIKSQFPLAVIMKANFIEERIVNLHKSPLSAEEHKVVENTPQSVVPSETKPQVTEKADKKTTVESLEKQIERISELVDKNDYEKALEIITAGMAARPESPELNGWHGTVLLKMVRPAEAIQYFQKAAELSPDVPDYHNGIGYCLSFLGRFNEAIGEFDKAVTLDPVYIDALTGLGIAYAKTGVKDKAMDVHNRLRNLDMDNANMLLIIIKTIP